MEACTDIQPIIEAPEFITSAIVKPVEPVESNVARVAAMGLVFSIAFSSSFVVGFYYLGPWLDSVRGMM